MMHTIIATYSSDREAQDTINLLTEHGFDSEQINLVMLDKKNEDKDNVNQIFNDDSQVDLGDIVDKEEMVEDYEVDEEDFNDTQKGVIEPIAAINIGSNQIDSFGNGDFMLAGPVMDEVENEEIIGDASEETKLDEILMAIGITEEEITAFEGRIKSGEILISIEVSDDELDEYREVLGQNEPAVIEILEEDLNL